MFNHNYNICLKNMYVMNCGKLFTRTCNRLGSRSISGLIIWRSSVWCLRRRDLRCSWEIIIFSTKATTLQLAFRSVHVCCCFLTKYFLHAADWNRIAVSITFLCIIQRHYIQCFIVMLCKWCKILVMKNEMRIILIYMYM